MATYGEFLQTYLDPLEQRMEKIEKRISKIEETLSKILSCLPPLSVDKEIVTPTFERPWFDAKPGSYTYQPLNSALNEIRILVVYSSLDEQDPITCELLHTSLNGDRLNDPESRSSLAIKEFKTLSYTWGNLENNRSIMIQGHKFPVTQNLEAALRNINSLQKPSKTGRDSHPTFWWIDAICINQNDVAERSQQVNLMTMIYRKASGAYIWLGEEDNDSELAMNLVRQLGSPVRPGPGDPDIAYPKITAERRYAHWKALTALFERPWWERVWVRQELALAKEATVHCGNHTCTFSAFSIAADILNKVDEQFDFSPVQQEMANAPSPLIPNSILTTSPYLQACILASFRTDGGRKPNVQYRDLTELILHTRSCKATDLRDKVFSMLGLVDPKIWELTADYRLSINDTLITAARNMISKKQSLDLLAGCQNPERFHGLPSWVPNLIDVWKARLFQPAVPVDIGDVGAEEKPDFAFGGEGNKLLRAEGRRFDIVDRLSDDTPQQNSSAKELDTLSANWKKFALRVLSNSEGDIMDHGLVNQFQHDDGAWIRFISGGADSGMSRPVTVSPLGTQVNYQMVKSLLLPEDHSESAANVDDMRRRIHAHLRKFGVGRRLCITKLGEEKGSAVIVPADAKAGDEIWIFRGTRSPYVLRKVEGQKYVVVGEAYSNGYALFARTKTDIEIETIWIV